MWVRAFYRAHLLHLLFLYLTLYFITSLPQAVDLGLKLVPVSRRDRVSLLTEAIIARVGAFVGSQILVSAMAATFMTLMALVLGLPSPIAIGIIIFVCGLVPLIGHLHWMCNLHNHRPDSICDSLAPSHLLVMSCMCRLRITF